MPERRHKDRIRVTRMNADLADMPCIIQSHVLPRAAGIGGFVDTIAVRDINADGRFAHASVDDIGINFGDRQSAHRACLEVAIGNALPILPGIFGLPDAAGTCAEIEGAQFVGVAGHGDNSATSEGSNAAPARDIVEVESHEVYAFVEVGFALGVL